MNELLRTLAQLAIAERVEAIVQARLGLHKTNELSRLYLKALEASRDTRRKLEERVRDLEDNYRAGGFNVNE